MSRRKAWVAAVFLLASCGERDGVPGYDALAKHVEHSRVGGDSDQWIEVRTFMGTSERVGLIFGYSNDRQACLDAIAGMKAANPGGDYVCTPAN